MNDLRTDLRRWIALCEAQQHGLLPITPQLIAAVREQFMEIDASSEDRLGHDDAHLAEIIAATIARIETAEPIAPTMTVVRAELRPRQTLRRALGSVGSHWCWDEHAAKVYHDDNAYDAHEFARYKRSDFTEVMLIAEVAFASIDWPFTLATNIRFPRECEITIQNGSQVQVSEIFFDGKSRNINRTVPVSGYYQH